MKRACTKTFVVALASAVALLAGACTSSPGGGGGGQDGISEDDISISFTPSGANGDCVPAAEAKSTGTLTAATELTKTSFKVTLNLSMPLCEPMEVKAAIYAMPGAGVAWPQSLGAVKTFYLQQAGDTVVTFAKDCSAVQFDVLTGATPPVVSPTGPYHGPLLFDSTALQDWGTWNCPPNHDPEVIPGDVIMTKAAGVRWKAQNSGNEIYLGVGDLGVGSNRVETAYTWSDQTYPVTFAFDGTDISQTISGGSGLSIAALGSPLVPPTCPIAEWDILKILLRDSTSTGGLRLDNLNVNGTPLGSLGAVDVAGSPGAQLWSVVMVDFSQPFTVTGDLVAEGWNAGGNEALRLEWQVGCTT